MAIDAIERATDAWKDFVASGKHPINLLVGGGREWYQWIDHRDNVTITLDKKGNVIEVIK